MTTHTTLAAIAHVAAINNNLADLMLKLPDLALIKLYLYLPKVTYSYPSLELWPRVVRGQGKVGQPQSLGRDLVFCGLRRSYE
jgi:hypothetical protein